MERPKKVRRHQLKLDMLAQPDDATCGPTCLHALYRYHGLELPLETLIRDVPKLENGGTLGVHLANDALRRGYRATLYTYNLQVFDPTWFAPRPLSVEALTAKLAAQARAKTSVRLRHACAAYADFLALGGRVRSEVLSGRLIRKYLNQNLPILTGLSSTYLYEAMREFGPDDEDDDIRGTPSGHFVVLAGYDRKDREVLIADPLQSNPHSATRRYSIGIDRVIASILLGVLTYDANLIIIEPTSPAP